MATVTPIIWKYRTNKAGESPIRLRVEHRGETKYLSLGVTIPVHKWNGRRNRVKDSHPNAAHINSFISDRVVKAEQLLLDQRREGLDIDIVQVVSELKGAADRKAEDFVALIHLRADELRVLNKIYTSNRYRSVAHKLSAYLKGRTLPCRRITPSFLRSYNSYLVTELDNKQSSRASDFRCMRAVYNRAVSDGRVKHDVPPFSVFNVVEPRSTKRKLSIAELAAIEELPLEKGSPDWHVRNYFMFSFYCAGLRWGDVCRLRWQNVRGEHLIYTMHKSKRPKQILLVDPAKRILELYQNPDSDQSSYIFSMLEGVNLRDAESTTKRISSRNAAANRILKRVAVAAGIGEELSFHMSRHSFADFARRQNVPVSTICMAMGHSGISVTQNYLKGFDSEVLDATMVTLFHR